MAYAEKMALDELPKAVLAGIRADQERLLDSFGWTTVRVRDGTASSRTSAVTPTSSPRRPSPWPNPTARSGRPRSRAAATRSTISKSAPTANTRPTSITSSAAITPTSGPASRARPRATGASACSPPFRTGRQGDRSRCGGRPLQGVHRRRPGHRVADDQARERGLPLVLQLEEDRGGRGAPSQADTDQRPGRGDRRRRARPRRGSEVRYSRLNRRDYGHRARQEGRLLEDRDRRQHRYGRRAQARGLPAGGDGDGSGSGR